MRVDLLEKMARAAYEHGRKESEYFVSWDSLPSEHRTEAIALQRAALLAIREPDEALTDALWDPADSEMPGLAQRGYVEAQWRGVIDHIAGD